jgi:hypothetical protein
MPKTRTKGQPKKSSNANGSGTKRQKVAQDPITVGGGGGRKLKRRLAKVGNSFIRFKRGAGHFLKKKSHQYAHETDVLLGIEISCPSTNPATGPDSVIQIDFSDSRVPDPVSRVSIVVTGNPLTITFTGDWVEKDAIRFGCAYLMVREIYVDNELAAKSDDGDCEVSFYNKPPGLRLRK